jgi:hypothetical protein
MVEPATSAPEPVFALCANDELPLTRLDDFPWHQAIAPLPLPATSDSHFNDGYYFGFFNKGWYGFFGLRLYANTNVMDGFAGAVTGGEQRTVRASRALRPNIDRLEVGPLRLTIVEPMRRQRLELLDNPTGVTFDVTVDASSPAFLETADIHYRRGRLLNHVLRYTQLGRVDGRLAVDGRSVAVHRWYGDRDHSWGIRASMGPQIPLRGTEPSVGDPRAIRIWMPFELEDHCGMFAMHEDSESNVLDFDGQLYHFDGRRTRLRGARHSFRYVAGSKLLRGGEFVLTDEEGADHRYEFEVVADPASAQGFGYVRGWHDGQPPGTWRGPEHLEHDRFTVNDPSTVAGPDHVPAECRLGSCEFPAAVRGPGGQRGMAQIEHMVYRAYRPYGFN